MRKRISQKLKIRSINVKNPRPYWQGIRLINIGAPDRGEEGWKETADFLEGMILNRVVWVEGDVDLRDQYNRYLGYIWFEGEMINLVLVEEGFAVPLEYPPNTKYAQVFEETYQR